jgi:hypothetical protein
MRQYTLILIYADSEEVQDLVERRLSEVGLEITRGVIISWHVRQDLDRVIMRIKDELIDMMERGFEGELAYALVELTEEQFRAVRTLIARKLESEDRKLLSYGEALLKRVRSSKSNKSIDKEYARFDRLYRRLVMLHEVFDIKPDLLNKVMDLARELRIEYERRRR